MDIDIDLDANIEVYKDIEIPHYTEYENRYMLFNLDFIDSLYSMYSSFSWCQNSSSTGFCRLLREKYRLICSNLAKFNDD